MNKIVRIKLIELARIRQTIGYQELTDTCNLNLSMTTGKSRFVIGKILDEISKYEYQHKRPLLSVLVIGKYTREPGNGFYKLCEKLGFETIEKLKSNIDFINTKTNQCYDFWSNDNHYRLYK